MFKPWWAKYKGFRDPEPPLKPGWLDHEEFPFKIESQRDRLKSSAAFSRDKPRPFSVL